MVKNVLCWLIFGSSSWSSIATGDSIQTGWRNIAKTIISKIVNTKFSLEGQKPLLQLSPRCFNVAENQCIQCNYQSQANMPQTRKLLKTHQIIATLQEIHFILATLHWGLQSCQESKCFEQLSCLRHICLTLIVALNTLIFGNVEAPGG